MCEKSSVSSKINACTSKNTEVCSPCKQNTSKCDRTSSKSPDVTANQNDFPPDSYCGGDMAALIINAKLNEIYEERICDIDYEANGDTELKVITLNEWVKSLQYVNKTLIENIRELELEATERLTIMQKKCNSSCRHSGGDSTKYKKDIQNLIELIRRARNTGSFNLCGLKFETLTENEILGNCPINMQSDEDSSQFCPADDDVSKNSEGNCNGERKKFVANMKALVIEIAEKYDEVCQLKKQICSLEDEIQKAQKKIQLKENVIRDQRNELKNCAKCPTCKGSKQSESSESVQTLMLPTSMDADSCSRSNIIDCGITSRSLFKETNETEQQHEDFCRYNEQMNCLQIEIDELLNLKVKQNQEGLNELRKMDCQRQKIAHLVQQWMLETVEANRKLDYFRNELINLDVTSGQKNFPTDTDSGFSSKAEIDPDAKIIDMFRKRFLKLSECSQQLKKQVQHFEISNNELKTKFKTQCEISEKSERILKEIACALMELTGQEITYNKVYLDSSSTLNPFCDAIYDVNELIIQKDKKIVDIGEELFQKCKMIVKCEDVIARKDEYIAELEGKKKLSKKDVETKHNTTTATTPSTSMTKPMTIKQKKQNINSKGLLSNLRHEKRKIFDYKSKINTSENKKNNKSATQQITTQMNANIHNQPQPQPQPQPQQLNSEDIDINDGNNNPPQWNW